MPTTTTVKGSVAGLLLREQVVWEDSERMHGTPCFTGTRVPIKTLFDYLEAGDSLTEFLDSFPGVTEEQAVSAQQLGKQELLSKPER
jgi:uncharacterized protein (DUF433 family)